MVGGLSDIAMKILPELKFNANTKLIVTGTKPHNHTEVIDKVNAYMKFVNITYVQTDICNAESLLNIKSYILNNYEGINGIINFCGIFEQDYDFNQLSSKDPILSVKIFGGRLLDEIFSDVKLDWFIMFGSLSSFAGV